METWVVILQEFHEAKVGDWLAVPVSHQGCGGSWV